MPESSETWVFRVKAYPDESLGHFLGRFRRANVLSHRAIADHLGINVTWVRDWDLPSRRRNPTPLQLIALSKLVEVAPEQLARMLPLEPLHLQTRLCPACYAEEPIHRIVWQQAGIDNCERASLRLCQRHQAPLLSACPVCNTGFRTPALWDDSHCEQCGLAFEEM